MSRDLCHLVLSSLASLMTTSTLQTWAADDRRESIHRPADGKVVVIVPGVDVCPLVSAQCRAHNLFTALLTLGAKASYPFYTRPFSEAIVLIEGEASVDVEDRSYRLKPFDAMTVSPHVPRRVVNLSAVRPSVLHIALASSTPDQTWVNGRYITGEQPTSATGQLGCESLIRNNTTARFEFSAIGAISRAFW